LSSEASSIKLDSQVFVESAVSGIGRFRAEYEAEPGPVELAMLGKQSFQRGIFLQLLGEIGVLTED
jgi:hypothetical protein